MLNAELRPFITEEVEQSLYANLPDLLAPRVQEAWRKTENKANWYDNDSLYIDALNTEYHLNHPEDKANWYAHDDYFWGTYPNDYPDADILLDQLRAYTVEALMLCGNEILSGSISVENQRKVITKALLEVGLIDALLQGTPLEFSYREEYIEEFQHMTLVESFATAVQSLFIYNIEDSLV